MTPAFADLLTEATCCLVVLAFEDDASDEMQRAGWFWLLVAEAHRHGVEL